MAQGGKGLLHRGLAFAVLTLGAVGCLFVAFTIEHSTKAESNIVPFGGWQPNLVDAGLLVVGIALIGLGFAGLHRYRVPAATGVLTQVVATVLAIAVGTGFAALGDLGGKHLITWASNHTAAAHRVAAEIRLAEGDATHRPVPPREPGVTAAPASLIRLLLAPTELGPTWQYNYNPQVVLRRNPPKPVDAPQATYSVQTLLSSLHWNGKFWARSQDLVEWASRYATRADALSELRLQLRGPASCIGCQPKHLFRVVRVAGQRVWRYDQDEGTGYADTTVFFLEKRSVVHLFITTFESHGAGVRSADDIVRLAVQVLTSAINRAEATQR